MILALRGSGFRRSRYSAELEQDPPFARRGMGEGGKGKKREYRRGASAVPGAVVSGGGRRIVGGGKSYYSVESMVALVCLTASLLILPLVLPPLPPPPLMLLLLPIGMLAVLLALAFMPSATVRDVTNTYV